MVPIEINKLMKRLKKNQISKEDKLIKWIRFINNPKEVGEEEMEESEGIKKAKEELKKIRESEKESTLALQREMYLMDMIATEEYGYDNGKKVGVEEKQKSVIIKMYKEKISIETISRVVELSEEEVKKIISEANITA